MAARLDGGTGRGGGLPSPGTGSLRGVDKAQAATAGPGWGPTGLGGQAGLSEGDPSALGLRVQPCPLRLHPGTGGSPQLGPISQWDLTSVRLPSTDSPCPAPGQRLGGEPAGTSGAGPHTQGGTTARADAVAPVPAPRRRHEVSVLTSPLAHPHPFQPSQTVAATWAPPTAPSPAPTTQSHIPRWPTACGTFAWRKVTRSS